VSALLSHPHRVRPTLAARRSCDEDDLVLEPSHDVLLLANPAAVLLA
jgi:hypothetical protein